MLYLKEYKIYQKLKKNKVLYNKEHYKIETVIGNEIK